LSPARCTQVLPEPAKFARLSGAARRDAATTGDMDVNALTATKWVGGPRTPIEALRPNTTPVERIGGGLETADEVELHSELTTADLVEETARIGRIRSEIADGTYLTPDKLDVVAARLLKVLRAAPLVDAHA
jgi:hypothetical protein